MVKCRFLSLIQEALRKFVCDLFLNAHAAIIM